MGDKRGGDYINLGAQYGVPWPDSRGLPRPDPTRGPVFVSHEESLRCDLEIVNARTVAELGPLPPGGLPVAPKGKYIPPQLAPRPEHGQENFENQEDEAMKLRQVVVVTAVAAGTAACGPAQKAVAAEQTQITTPTVRQAASVAPEMHAEPKAAAVPERATADAAPMIPDEIRAFVPQDSTLLAYKRFDLTGDGNEDAVLIIRHPVTGTYADYSKNPCDLIVLHNGGRDFKLVTKGSKVIDCTYKNFERERASRPDDLNDLIELKLREIIYHNEKERPGNATFRFELSKTRGVWRLDEIKVVHVRSGEKEVEVFEQTASYPRDFGLITMDEFDPFSDQMNAVLLKNEKEIR